MKRTVEIEDSLQERVEGACEEVKDLLIEYLDENKDDFTDEGTEPPCLHNDLDYDGRVHEIVDGSVPIYTSEIKDTWYMHASELEEAYENAGVGDNPRENNGMAAIYFYISECVCEWYRDNAESILEEWQSKQGIAA